MQVNAHIARKTDPGAGHRGREEREGPAALLRVSEAGVDIVEDGLKEMTFGEFLVEQGVLDRFQLFRALQMQDRLPGVRLGECAAALGYAPIAAIERLYERFQQITTVDVPDQS